MAEKKRRKKVVKIAEVVTRRQRRELALLRDILRRTRAVIRLHERGQLDRVPIAMAELANAIHTLKALRSTRTSRRRSAARIWRG